MQKLSQKIIVVLLTPILLFSTTSFTIEKHICGEMICSVGLEGIDFSNHNNEKSYAHSEVSSCQNEGVSFCT